MASDPRVPGWREKCLDGTITLEEYGGVVAFLRQERRAAEELSKLKKASKKRKATKTEIQDDE